MKYVLKMTGKAKEDLLSLELLTQERIAQKLRFYVALDNPIRHAKKLVDSQIGAYRFRVGDYRIIFDIDKRGVITILLILRIKHRKDVYDI